MATDEESSTGNASDRQLIKQLHRSLRAALAAAAGIPVVAFVALAAMRIAYPYELEWLESEMLVHVQRLVDGLDLYGAPSVDAAQVPYAPLSFAFAAVFGQVVPVDFALMRIISTVATIATLWLLYRIVKDDTDSRVAGVLAAGIYAGSFRIAGAFYDVGKADALFMLLSLAAIGMARLDSKRWHPVAAGLLMALAILAKQTALFFFAPVALYLLITRWRNGVIFTTVTLGVSAVVAGVLHVVTDGWYTYFVWELLFQHDVEQSARLGFLEVDMLPYWPMLAILALTATTWLRRTHLWNTGFFVFAAGGLIAGAWTGRLHSGGYDNVLMPAVLAIALCAGLAVGRAFQDSSVDNRSLLRNTTIVVMCILQLWFLRYDIGAQLPVEADERAGDAFIQRLERVEGDVLVLSHPGYAVMAGKAPTPGKGALEDVLRGTDEGAKALVLDSFAGAIHQQRWGAIVLDDTSNTRMFPPDWQAYYYLSAEQIVPPGTFRPVVNQTGVPSQLWLPYPAPLLPD